MNGSGIIRYLEPGIKLKIIDLATLMIIVSDNVATRILIEILGKENINHTIESLGFEKTHLFGDYELNPEYKFRLGNTTPKEYGKFYEMLLKNELWSEDISKKMLDILKKNTGSVLLKKGLKNYISGYAYSNTPMTSNNDFIKYIASKSGTIAGVRSDGGIISTCYGEYILSVFIVDFHDPFYSNDNEVISQFSSVNKLIFDQFIALEGKFSL